MRSKQNSSTGTRLLLWGTSFGLLYVSMMFVFVGVMAPAQLVEPVVETTAVAEDIPRDTQMYNALVERLAVAGRARLEPSEASQLLSPWQDVELGRIELTATDRRHLAVNLSHPLGTTWFNIQLVAREITWSEGRFQRIVVEELTVSKWDLTSLAQGRDIADLVNQRLGRMLQRNPHAQHIADALDVLDWNGRHLMVEVRTDRLDDAFPRSLARR